jgi:glycosyltransferase involved in cell wall biosynthesis
VFAETDAVVTLTQKIWPILREWDGLRGRTLHHEVIPCCVDLERFRFSEEERTRRRGELGLTDQFTIVYSGSLDGWYLTETMADFFAQVVRRNPRAHLLWLTNGSPERVKELMKSRDVGVENFSVLSVATAEVPSYLAAADAGIAFIKRCVSKLASSPTKNGEYLACGLPLILNEGIGDSDALISEWQAGVLITDFTEADFATAAANIEAMARVPGAREKARRIAEQVFHLERVGGERYASLYERVLNS